MENEWGPFLIKKLKNFYYGKFQIYIYIYIEIEWNDETHVLQHTFWMIYHGSQSPFSYSYPIKKVPTNNLVLDGENPW